MDSLTKLEEYYQNYVNNLALWLPDGMIHVDIHLLNSWNLLSAEPNRNVDESLTRYFHVIESPDKITLVNDQFVVWITPENVNGVPTTFALVALNTAQGPHLEVVFEVSGVYNTSGIVLKVIDKFLKEIQENEDLLHRYEAV